jgi:hypothetical protein
MSPKDNPSKNYRTEELHTKSFSYAFPFASPYSYSFSFSIEKGVIE